MANAKFAKAEDAKRGKPLQEKKREIQKNPISNFWLGEWSLDEKWQRS
jgi:hypothetical protein